MSSDPFDDTKLIQATQKLISEVRSRPVLWNKHVCRTKEDMAAAWLQVSSAMNMSDDVLKPKWKNLRDMFKREFAKALKLDKEETQWRYYKYLKFLEINNYTTPEMDTEFPLSSAPITTIIKLESVNNQDEDIKTLLDPIDISDSTAQTHEDVNVTSQLQGDEDYDFLFLKSLLPFFNNLTPIRKLVVRNKMQELLLNEISRNMQTDLITDSD